MKDVRYQATYIDEIATTAIKFLVDKYREMSTIVFQAPTGSGKTYMISQTLTRVVKECSEPFSFVWISVNSLHEQSRQNLTQYLEDERLLECISIDEIQNNTLEQNEIAFFNWDSLIKDNNVFRMDNERDWNLQNVVANTKDEGRRIILIIDESHRTAKADKAKDVIAEIGPALTIEMTATPTQIHGTRIDIPLGEVINAGMIKKEVQINPNGRGFKNDEDFLDAALRKRQELKREFEALGKNINPLLLIQIPNKRAGEAANPEDEIVGLLADRDITTRNGRLGIWLDKKKENRESVEMNDSPVEVLIFKEAIAVGWDCPRASILYLQREWKQIRYIFNIQTLGRIMRMPEQVHYEDRPQLNVGYVYSASDNFEIVQELAGDYVSSLQMIRDEELYEKPLRIPSEFIRRKVELTRLSSEFKKFLFEAAYELDLKTEINTAGIQPQKTIGIRGRINAIDVAQTVEFEKTLKIRMGEKQVADEYTRFTVEQSDPFMPNSSSHMIKSSLRSWFKVAFDTGDEDYIGRVVMQRFNKPKFKALLALAKDKYKERPTRSDEKVPNLEWEIPSDVSLFKTNYTPLASSRKSILKEPETGSFFVKISRTGNAELSGPEALFIDALESSDDEIQWWFKNGTRESKYFSIAYVRLDGRMFGFYPDFIVKTKKETLIVEIKDDRNLRSIDNLLKLNAGRAYLLNSAYEQKEERRFYILSPDDFENFFQRVRNRDLDNFASSFEQGLLTYHKSNQVVLVNKSDKTEDESLELQLLDELDKTIAELEDTKLKNELLELSLQQAEENLSVIGKAIGDKKSTNEAAIQIPIPFEICVLGEVSNEEITIQQLHTYFTKHGIKTNDWRIKFFNNTKLQNSDILRSLIKGQSRYSLVVTGQIHHHAGKGNNKSNLLSELKNEKYIPHVIGSDPKNLLTPEKILEVVDSYLKSSRQEA